MRRMYFWFRGGLQVLEVLVGASALYGFLMWLQMDSSRWTDLLTMLPLYMMLFGAFMLLAMTLGLYKQMLGLALSLGSTRREALAGLHLYRLLPAAVVAVLVAVLSVIPDVEALFPPVTLAVVSLSLFLLFGALGSVLGMIYNRFGKVGAVIMGVAFVLLGIGAGVLTAMTIGDGPSWILTLLDRVSVSWLFLILSAAVYGLVSVFEYFLVRKYQVRL